VLLGALAERLGGRRVAVSAAPPAAPAPAQAAAATVPAAASAARAAEPGAPVVSSYAGQPRMVPIIRKFGARLDAQLAAMDAALAGGDLTELAALAHWLKGAGGTVGYHAFTEPARVLETGAKAGDREAAAAALRELRHLAGLLVVPALPPTAAATA
jgi:HPt (histidine-containing phosphotransfer) domain-containing protein